MLYFVLMLFPLVILSILVSTFLVYLLVCLYSLSRNECLLLCVLARFIIIIYLVHFIYIVSIHCYSCDFLKFSLHLYIILFSSFSRFPLFIIVFYFYFASSLTVFKNLAPSDLCLYADLKKWSEETDLKGIKRWLPKPCGEK